MEKPLTRGVTRRGEASPMTIDQQPWGTTQDGRAVDLFTLANERLRVTVTNFGGRIVSLHAPDRDGNNGDVVLGYDSLAGYEADKTYFGALIGRLANRLAKGRFTLNGVSYQVPCNNGPNALHGGPFGFDKHVWSSDVYEDTVEFSLTSPGGEMGFPGNLQTVVRYTLDGPSLRIEFEAMTDKDTVVNLTNHAYFNLSGEPTQPILDHLVTINADRFTPINETLIPTGELASVAGTPFDFNVPTAIGARIEHANEQLSLAGGYDHNFVLRPHASGELFLAAHAHHPASGRTLTVSTTQPGMQFYSGNFLNGTAIGKHKIAYQKRTGFCFETQHFPDSPNHPNFPSVVLKPGETFRQATVFTFGISD